RKFRFRKETNNAAIIMKIDKDKQLVVLDEEHEGISPDELKDELPERQPRYPSRAAGVWLTPGSCSRRSKLDFTFLGQCLPVASLQ
uniref:Glia maturation factor beta n=1 Tax=Cairina moschata TaxID=8855 RepID=A0A8C3C2H2_CAIMO